MLAILDDDCKPRHFETGSMVSAAFWPTHCRSLPQTRRRGERGTADLVERIASEWPYSGEAEPPTLTELYDEISGSDACIIDSDGDMIPAQRMGAAALKALGLSLEDDDQ